KDDCDKTLIPNTENLAAKIFRKNFHPAGATRATDLTVPELLPAAATPPTEVDAQNYSQQRPHHPRKSMPKLTPSCVQ
uniref:Uncharacterized protein n=1 Tax=Romanomermis culicivorax TaxID=13658 RepID=A0A915IK51_ROMCU